MNRDFWARVCFWASVIFAVAGGVDAVFTFLRDSMEILEEWHMARWDVVTADFVGSLAFGMLALNLRSTDSSSPLWPA